MTCPENIKCNPPPPQQIPCPDPSKLDADDYRPPSLPQPITRRSDGTCVVPEAPPVCPPQIRCNPPPPKRVPCPENPADLVEDYYKPK